MGQSVYPSKYLTFNEQQTKLVSLVVKIEGLADLFSLTPLFTRIRYGDPGLNYGDPGLIYGGLRRLSNVRPYLSLESSLTIGQKLEPEQGRASLSTFSLSFIDYQGFMGQLISPGVILDEILGNREVKIYLGYKNTSFPEDYFVVFRGLVSNTSYTAGMVTLGLTDANQKRRSQVFFTNKTQLTAGIGAASGPATIPVNQTLGMYDHILGPTGVYDTAVRTWIKIDNEFMEYGPGDLGGTSVAADRGGGNSRGSAVVSHSINTPVENSIEITDNAITAALKIQLSGWNGPWKTGVLCTALGTPVDTDVPFDPKAICMTIGENVVEDYGLTAGDKVTISGSTVGNDGTYTVVSVADAFGRPNQLLYIDTALVIENPAPTVSLAFRSKYDTLPTAAGLKMKPTEVDVAGHEKIRDSYFSGLENTLKLFVTEAQTGKEFIEKECFLPVGAYSLTRYGRLSIGYTRPPIAEDKLVVIDHTSVLEPDKIRVERGLNNRRFYNEVTYDYDHDDNGNFQSNLRVVDTESLSKIDLTSTLPIASKGLKSALGGALLASRRGRNFLTRYKNAAYEVNLKVNWKVGSVLENGDVVLLKDEGKLKILDFDTGERDVGVKLFEVIDRKVDLKSGQVTLKLLSGIAFTLTDRYGVISPSSVVGSGSTSSRVRITDSYGAVFPGAEWLKWEDYAGQKIKVHSYDWTVNEETTLVGLDAGDPYVLVLDPPLSFAPTAGQIVDIGDYPTGTDPTEAALYKLVHCFLSPTLTVVSGVSATQFNVSAPDAAKVQLGQFVNVHNTTYTIDSPERKVLSVVGTLVTVDGSLGFTPAAGQKVDLVGFADKQAAYRWL